MLVSVTHTLLRSLFNVFLALTVFTSQAQAGFIGLIRLGALPTREFSQLGVQSSKKLAEAGIARTEIAASEKQVALIFFDTSGAEMKRFFMNRSTAKELEQFKPSKFREWAGKVKTNAGKIALAKAAHFPMEASSFFVALGALTVYDLIFNYSANPLVAEQFLQSQKDPVSQVSFLAFMAANGLAAEPLMEMVEKPWLRKYIPYLGMAVGMAASQMVHGISQSELLRSCAKSLTAEDQGKSAQKCDAAWAGFGTGWGPVVSEFSTGLVSMFMSSVFSTATSWVAGIATQKAIQWMGMELLTFAIPGGGMSRAVRFAINTGNNLQFLAWDAYLRDPIDNFLVNSGSNQVIQRMSECLGAHLSKQKRNKWQDNDNFASDETFSTRHFCDGNMVQSTDKFFNQYRDWRSANLKSAISAQQNWFQYLSILTNQYRTTQSFYQAVTDKVYKKMYKLADKSSSPLDQIVPLFGVAQTSGSEIDWTQYLEYPQDLEKEQIAVANNVAGQMIEDKAAADGLYQGISTWEKKIFDQVQVALASTDSKAIGRGLDQINRIFERPAGRIPAYHEFLTSDVFKTGFKSILGLLGKPVPQWTPGQGFLTAWNHVEGKEISPFSKSISYVSTPTAPEYLVASMAWGPDAAAGENLISAWGFTGFQASFQPPKILRGKEVQRTAVLAGENGIFKQKVWIDSNPQACGSSDSTCYHPVFDWVRSGHVRPDILTPDGNNFSVWWNQNVEPQYLKAWKSFEVKYEENVQDVSARLFNRKNYFANNTVVPNSPFLALEQERSVALFIINSIYNSEAGINPKESLFNRKFDIIKDADQLKIDSFPALSEYQEEWKRARELFKKIRTPLSGQQYFVSRLKDSDLKTAQENLDAKLKLVTDQLQSKANSKSSLEMAKSALTSLTGSHQELLDYGLIINSASYVENNIGDGSVNRKRCTDQLKASSSVQNSFRGLDNNKDCQNPQDLVKSPN